MTHTLRNYLKEQGLVEAKISGGENSTDSSFYKVHPEIKHYKYGVVQPAVLCVDTEGKKLFAWAIDPKFVSDFFSFFDYFAISCWTAANLNFIDCSPNIQVQVCMWIRCIPPLCIIVAVSLCDHSLLSICSYNICMYTYEYSSS